MGDRRREEKKNDERIMQTHTKVLNLIANRRVISRTKFPYTHRVLCMCTNVNEIEKKNFKNSSIMLEKKIAIFYQKHLILRNKIIYY